MRARRYLTAGVLLLVCALVPGRPAFADYAQGDICSVAGRLYSNAQSADYPGPQTFICDGANLQYYTSALAGPTRFGIGMASPATALDVSGTVRVGDGGEICSANVKGGVRFTSVNTLQYCNSSVWKTVSTGAGAGTPAGSTTQVQFNSGGAFGADSNFNWDNTNKRLGIGTAAPGAALTVVGAGSGNIDLTVNGRIQTGTGSSAGGVWLDNAQDIFIGQNPNVNAVNGIGLYVGGPGGWAMNIDQSGKVGIGTASPVSSLNVASGSVVLGASNISNQTSAFVVSGSATNGNYYGFFAGQDSTHNLTMGWAANATAASGYSFVNSWSTPLALQSSGGNVGIGTTSPQATLHVYNTGSNVAIFGNSTTGTSASAAHQVEIIGSGTLTPLTLVGGDGGIEFWKDATPSAAIAFGMAKPGTSITSDFVVSAYNGSAWNENFRILTSNGNVGIGVTGPATKLDVAGTVKVADGGETCAAGVKGGIRYTSTNVLQYCNSSAWKTLTASGGSVTAAGSTKQVQFNSGGVLGASANFNWDNANGRLGIGTASPAYTLDVLSTAIRSQNPFDAYIDVESTAAAGRQWSLWSDSNGVFRIADFGHLVGGGWGTVMAFNSVGHVGLGTTTPGELLFVSGGNLAAATTLPVGSTALPAIAESGAGTRMMWYPKEAAFRAGGVYGTEWDAGNIGSYSAAFGEAAIASGWGSMAFGSGQNAAGVGSLSGGIHNQAINAGDIALGSYVIATGNYSMGLGLSAADNADATRPSVTGAGSFGIFMQDQTNKVFAANNTMALLGGNLVIDPNSQATLLAANANTNLDVNGNIGAVHYCDVAGANCFTAASIAAGGAAAGSTKQVQFNSGGVLGASANFNWDNANGRLGIGTATPAGPIEIVDAGAAGTIRMKAPANSGLGLVFGLNNSYSGANGGSIYYNAWGPAGSLNFSAGGTSNPIMTVASTGNVGIGTSTPGELLFVSGGNLAAATTRAVGSASLPAIAESGAGTRMMWYPKKAAFRAGNVDSTQWDDASIGNYSDAFGYDTLSSGTGSVAMGYGTSASGDGSVAMGWRTTTSGSPSLVAGQYAVVGNGTPGAVGNYSVAFGLTGTSTANYAAVTGNGSFGIFMQDQHERGHDREQRHGAAGRQDDHQPGTGGGAGTVSTPQTALEVLGTVMVSDGGETCSATVKGGIRYTSANTLQYCNSSAWKTISTGACAGTPAGRPRRSSSTPAARSGRARISPGPMAAPTPCWG